MHNLNVFKFVYWKYVIPRTFRKYERSIHLTQKFHLYIQFHYFLIQIFDSIFNTIVIHQISVIYLIIEYLYILIDILGVRLRARKHPHIR